MKTLKNVIFRESNQVLVADNIQSEKLVLMYENFEEKIKIKIQTSEVGLILLISSGNSSSIHQCENIKKTLDIINIYNPAILNYIKHKLF